MQIFISYNGAKCSFLLNNFLKYAFMCAINILKYRKTRFKLDRRLSIIHTTVAVRCVLYKGI